MNYFTSLIRIGRRGHLTWKFARFMKSGDGVPRREHALAQTKRFFAALGDLFRLSLVLPINNTALDLRLAHLNRPSV